MAGESCNLDKDEAEILKPSSSSPPSPPPPTSPPSSSPPSSSLFLKPCEEFPAQRQERPEAPATQPPAVLSSEPKPDGVFSTPKPDEESQRPVRFSNRCSTCRRRVGLTGFRCRCGDLFCARHRYSDIHDCSFDFKAAGREEIAKANPVIKAAKIIKI